MSRSAQWYCDENAIGLGRQLAQARLPVTWPGDSGQRLPAKLSLPESPVSERGLPDEEWIPQVARAGLAIITKDARILSRRVELDAVLASRARLFVIDGTKPLDLWGELRVVAAQWDAIVQVSRDPGPYIYSISKSRTSRIDGWA